MNKAQKVKHPRDMAAAARALQAFDLIVDGHTYAEAATQAGYASSGACWNAVHREIEHAVVEDVDTYRKFHLRRLKRLRKVFMPKAEGGDGWSADRIVRWDEREAQLMALDLAAASAAVNQPYQKRIVLMDRPAAAPEPTPTPTPPHEGTPDGR